MSGVQTNEAALDDCCVINQHYFEVVATHRGKTWMCVRCGTLRPFGS